MKNFFKKFLLILAAPILLLIMIIAVIFILFIVAILSILPGGSGGKIFRWSVGKAFSGKKDKSESFTNESTQASDTVYDVECEVIDEQEDVRFISADEK